MKITQKIRKVMATLLSVAMIMTLCVGLDFGAITVEATYYSNQTWYITTDDDGTIQSVNFQFQTSDTAAGTWYLYLWDKNDTSGTNNRPQVLSSTSQTTSDGSHSMTINYDCDHGKEYLIGMVLKDSSWSNKNTSGADFSDWPYLDSVCDMVDCDDDALAGGVYINGEQVSGSVSDSLKTEEKPGESTGEGEEEEEDTPTGATYTFSYAYDCQRSPAYPKKGDSVTMSGFIGPYINNSSDNSAIAAGWSLVSDGKYDSTTHTELTSLVNRLNYNGYTVDAADMEVYKLVREDTDTVVATGFIFATMGSDGLLYISSNNFGYYICDKALTENDTVTATADGDISNPAIPGGEEPPHVCEFGDWVITKEATAETDGEKERKCECGETETAVVKFVPEADENTGILTEDTKPEDNACNADIEIDVEDIITDIGLTDEEILKIENGEDISVYLEVENADATVSTEDKTATENALTADMKVGMYLDINLLKKIGNNNPTAITETKQPITITFVVPDKLINTDTSKTRTYKIIRVHNGTATVLDCSFNPATKTASFATDKFSSYAIAYVDTIDNSNNNNNNVNKPSYTTVPNPISNIVIHEKPDQDNDYEGEDVSSEANVVLDETILETGNASESDVTVYITFTMFTLSVAYAIFKKKKHE